MPGHEGSRWGWADRGRAGPPGAGAVGGGGPDRGRGPRPGGGQALAGDADVGESVAAGAGAWLVFEDESGQGFRPPKGRTWGRRGVTPVVTITRLQQQARLPGRAALPQARPTAAADHRVHHPPQARHRPARRLHRSRLRPAAGRRAPATPGAHRPRLGQPERPRQRRHGRAYRGPAMADRLPAPALRARTQPGRTALSHLKRSWPTWPNATLSA
jgi:hypothetical protein